MMLATDFGSGPGSFDADMIREKSAVAIIHQVSENYPNRDAVGSFWISLSAPSSTQGTLLGCVIHIHTPVKSLPPLTKCVKASVEPVLTHGEMVEKLVNSGLPVSSLADMFGVTRATVYSWQQGADPQVEKQERIETVFRLLSTVDRKCLPLFSKVWLRKIEGGQSMYEVLTAKELNAEGFNRALSSVQPLFQKLIDRANFPRKSVAVLVDETLAAGVSSMEEWENMPAVGREII